MRGDFSASPLCRWFWLPLPSLVFKRWILVLTRELTPLPSLSPGCLPDCFTGQDILGHMLMRITLSEREDASTGVFRMRLSDRNITPSRKPHWPVALPRGWEWLYILPLSHICSLYAVILPVNTRIRWQGSTWAKYSLKCMDYRLVQSHYMGSCVFYWIFPRPLIKCSRFFCPVNMHSQRTGLPLLIIYSLCTAPSCPHTGGIDGGM